MPTCRLIWFSILTAGLMLSATMAPAQIADTGDVLSTGQGLSQGMVQALLRDREGFLWIGTKDGLNRYDGYGFKVFTNDAHDPFSISDNNITKLLEDRKGWIWAGTGNGRLHAYDKKTGRFHGIGAAPGSSRPADGCLSGNAAVDFELDEKGQLVVCSVDAAGQKTLETLHLPDDFFTKNTLPTARRLLLPGHVAMVAMGVDSLGRAGVLGANGVAYRLNAGEGSFAEAFSGADAAGFSKRFRPTDQAALTDYSGIFWVSTLGFGLRKNNPARSRFPLLAEGKSIDYIVPAGPQSLIFRSAQQFASFRLDYATKPVQPTAFPSVQVSDNLLRTKSGIFWGKSGEGLCRLTPDGKQAACHKGLRAQAASSFDLTTPSKSVLATGGFLDWQPMLEDRQGNIWLAGLNGALACFGPDPAGKAWGYNFSDKSVQMPSRLLSTALYEDGEGVLWIGTQAGFVRAIRSDNPDEAPKFTWFTASPSHAGRKGERQGLNYKHVTCLLDDPQQPSQYLWICTKGGGLNRMDKKTGEFLYLTTQEGLPDNVVYGILSDAEGNIWGSTNRGIFCLTVDGGRQTVACRPPSTVRRPPFSGTSPRRTACRATNSTPALLPKCRTVGSPLAACMA